MARPLLAVAGIAVIGVGVAIGFGGWGFGSTVSRDATLTQEIRGVKLENGSGDVRIRTAAGAARVHQTLRYHFSGEPGDAYRVEGDQLVIVDCGRNCTADMELIVPAGIPVTGSSDSGTLDFAGVGSVDVTADSGQARMQDVAGPVKLRMDSGSTELHNVGEVQVHSQSGRIEGDGLRGPVDVSAGSGRIELTLTQPSNVKAQADSGRVEVSVPRTGSYQVTGSSESGRRSIDIPQNSGPDAKTLELNTDSGSVTVKAV
ncbi:MULTISPECIES: DUF4097 family beta strand repeat-containing protein [Amycolatopsis]|uniref:DUF4097 family beta strand repeat protein n=1 Tax=Amycolatopsis dendrobii TaxID=2760662 RepID=A0A7W3VZ42_9PSEU|nr:MULTISPECIES: DUF4097 family beta strand repeat-containing protein [Amycolatopsis]MBB1155888.1 DUF4097 family beta strand repeat protein [Amycolatopsis dendrobii]UKD53087.1 DUF4097 domain-containing protein [Amycolatopsis sp. FU40]